RLDSRSPVQLSPKNVDEVGILCKQGCDAHAVVTIPGGFKLLQDCLDGSFVCCHGYPPGNHPNPTTFETTRYEPNIPVGNVLGSHSPVSRLYGQVRPLG